jgi:hypothetical protein
MKNAVRTTRGSSASCSEHDDVDALCEAYEAWHD